MKLFGKSGTAYTLEKTPFGSGGEGDVYRAFITKIVKLYKPGVVTEELKNKLDIMLRHPPDENVIAQVAWPLDLILDKNAECIGFTMPELSINAELGEVYKYPPALSISLHQKINIAQNICVVISAVHKAGYVFGDFNPRNIGLDTNTGLVSFLDTDTYHVKSPEGETTYRCNVCAPGYAAPELLEKCADFCIENPQASKNAYAMTPLPTFTRETDNFALAIHMFKLLMNGYTPFGGIIESASVSQSSPGVGDTAVRRDSYCFKPGFKPMSAAIPLLESFPLEISDLFTRAFIEGRKEPSKRPTAVEWYKALEKFLQTLVTCPDNPLHQYDAKNDACPYCEADDRYKSVVYGHSVQGDELKQTTYTPAPQVAPQSRAKPAVQVVQPVPHAQTIQASSGANASQLSAAKSQTAQKQGLHTNQNTRTQSVQQQLPPVSTNTALGTGTKSYFPSSVVELQHARVGDLIKFGSFEWKVLEVKRHKLLIISNCIIEQRRYGKLSIFGNMTWKKSEIRKYLNSDFLLKFSPREIDMILRSDVPNPDNKWYGISGGDSTDDKVFLLSIDEVVKYFGDSGQLTNRPSGASGISDMYNSQRIARDARVSASWWWLRSPGYHPDFAADVDYVGNLDMRGSNVSWSGGGVRPALWLNLTP